MGEYPDRSQAEDMMVIDKKFLSSFAFFRSGLAVRQFDIHRAAHRQAGVGMTQHGDRILHMLKDLVERDQIKAPEA